MANRVPLAVDLDSRDGTVDQDSLVKNGVMEVVGQVPRLRKRAGVTTAGTQTDKLALLHYTARNGSYITDSIGAVAMGDPSGSTIYGASMNIGETVANPFGDTYTWNGSAWTHGAGFNGGSISGSTTVFGVVHLDGYFFVMDAKGKIYNTGLNTLVFAATDYLSLTTDGSSPVALCRHGDFVVGFSTGAMQPYYDAGNPTGSVLSPVRSGFSRVGCLKGRSIASAKETTFWLGFEKERGPGVYAMQGMVPQRISTPAVDRIIAADDFATVYGTCATAGGHDFYLLSLVTSGLTLAFDINLGKWSIWTSLAAGSNKSVTSITRSGTTATVVTSTSHGMSDGDPVTIAGADQSDYNGLFQISKVDATTFEIEVANSPTTPATGTITATPYTESYFAYVRYIGSGNPAGSMLPATGTTFYKFSDTTNLDNSLPINLFSRLPRSNYGTMDPKKMARIRAVGDVVSDTAMVRWSDDDCATFSDYRRIDLSKELPEIRRCGAFRNRTIEFKHIGNTAPVLDALEMELGK